MTNKLPPCFAFKNTGKHPRKDEIKKRFNEMGGINFVLDLNVYYGLSNNGIYIWFEDISAFGSTVVEITEDGFLAMTEPALTELPKVFAFKNNPNSPNHDLLRGRFDGFFGTNGLFLSSNNYYGRTDAGDVGCCPSLQNFGKDVVEITEQQFLDLTEPELTKLPDNFYFQYVDEKDREVLEERFGGYYAFWEHNLGGFYGRENVTYFKRSNKKDLPKNSTEITQADFIRLTEPKKKVEPEIVTEHLPEPEFPYKGDIKDFPKEVVEWMLDNQVKQGNKRDISVFEKYERSTEDAGGFNWLQTGEFDFCEQVIANKNFGLFFEKYPKKTSPEKTITGQIIEISERGILIELTKEQIEEFKIFETVTIK